MATPIIDFGTALNNAIQAGQTVVEGNVVKIVADSGAEVANATYQVINGGNGVTQSVATVTSEVTGGTATTSGLALMTMDLGVLGAAIAPALGVVAGVGLYNVAPEFWTNVSNALVSAGKTIGGKFIAYTDGQKLYLDQDTIEIFKNNLINDPLLQINGGLAPLPDGDTYSDPALNGYNFRYGIKGLTKTVTDDDNPKILTTYYVTITGYTGAIFENPLKQQLVIFAGYFPFFMRSQAIHIDVHGASTTLYDIVTPAVLSHYGGVDFYYVTYSSSEYGTYCNPIETLPSGSDVQKIAYSILFGDQVTNPNVQTGATLPNTNPFPLSYPDWYPFNYPQTSAPGVPIVYPLKYPDIDPIKNPNQDQAQDPKEDPENIIEKIIKHLPIRDPIEDPEIDVPSDEVEDDEDGDDEEDIEDPKDPVTDPDPEDPNDEPTATPVIPDPTIPDSVSSNKLFTVYNPSSSNLNALGAYLWDSDLVDTLKKLWQNPLDGVISLIQVYATPTTSGSSNIYLGYLDSGVNAPVVSSQFVTVDCGTVNISEKKKNATDYSPFVSLHVYLPFIGIVELDINEFMNGSMGIKYKIDVYTGTCIAEIKSTRAKDMPNGNKIYEFSGNCAQQIPLTSGSASGALSALVSGVSAGLSIASGGALGVVAGASIAGHSLTHEMFHVTHSGNLSSNAGILGSRKPFVILGRCQSYDANGYNSFYGYPANKTMFLNNCSGFVKVKECHVKTTATQPEYEEIVSLLKSGVIV